MFLQIDQTRLVFYLLQNLGLTIHHIFIFKDLFDGDNLIGFLYLSLQIHSKERLSKIDYLEAQAFVALSRPVGRLLTLKTLPKAPLPRTCKKLYLSSLLAAFYY